MGEQKDRAGDERARAGAPRVTGIDGNVARVRVPRAGGSADPASDPSSARALLAETQRYPWQTEQTQERGRHVTPAPAPARQPQRAAAAVVQPPTGRVPSAKAAFWVTLIFGLWGLIPTVMHANEASRSGQSTGRYWQAFALGMVLNVVLGVVLFFVLMAAMVGSL